MKLLATLTAVAALATPAGFVQSQQREDGSFGDAQITAWVDAISPQGRTLFLIQYVSARDPSRPRCGPMTCARNA